MSLVVNHNLMASNTARNLGIIYDRLAKSTQRLSTGLRINSAADDAAGLAIRELMRADIATMNQGIRNASDGISMIQTAEGAMSVIDEKLTRMKELAEQAATGTYTTVQREIMNSEYQSMANEIDRIANATDFNGIKLLDGSMSSIHNGSGMKIHFGTGNSAAEDYYFVMMGDVRATSEDGLMVGGDATNDIWGARGAGGGGAAPCCGGGITALDQDLNASGSVFAYGYNHDLSESTDTNLSNPSYLGGLYRLESNSASLTTLINAVNEGTQSRVRIDFSDAALSTLALGDSGALNICLGEDEVYQFISGTDTYNPDGATQVCAANLKVFKAINTGSASTNTMSIASAFAATILASSQNYWALQDGDEVYIFRKDGQDYDSQQACEVVVAGTSATGNAEALNAASAVGFHNLETGTTSDSAANFAFGGENWGTLQSHLVNGQYGVTLNGRDIGDEFDLRIVSVGTSASIDEISFNYDAYSATNWDETTNIYGLGQDAFEEIQNASWGEWDGANIRTQSHAQEALDALQDAIERKDIIRANLGAYQNRLANTITNMGIMSENLQASESRISDIDVATEMTEFTRNNILAQAAVSMLSQANSLPQLALSLLG
jgi:flagellin